MLFIDKLWIFCLTFDQCFGVMRNFVSHGKAAFYYRPVADMIDLV